MGWSTLSDICVFASPHASLVNGSKRAGGEGMGGMDAEIYAQGAESHILCVYL